ncbi:MAG: T9SS C-terminal target domain-containing protein [Runella slithyformis]|nr:MAG: T9SS C-terminal target domain-containing protein [Runella slithyformis]TAF24564.1 MAG: T9SS C-terminal target domain-containing protein [Runella slithyformis]TAF49468.1 MAG: T9SS C-terminal target domain-containing protein [Runella slithyformis]TAF79308.1 MAG: T9SS C-terminal target domain-containing protein [Runella slithyformis]
MKIHYLLACLTAVFCQITAYAQQPLLLEDFDLTAGARLSNNGWTAHGGAGVSAVAVVSPGLAFSGLFPVGNAANMTTSGEDVSKVFAPSGVATGAVYASFLINVSAAQMGDYFLHLGPATLGSAFAGRVYVQASGAGFKLGLSKGVLPANTSAGYTTATYSFGQTIWLVLKYEFRPNANDDLVSLFVNPMPTTTEPTTPALSDANSADFANMGTIALRQGSATNAPTLRIDYLRVGNSWASATDAPMYQTIPPVSTQPKPFSIADARKQPLNTPVIVAGRVTVAQQFGNALYLQDGTGGIPVFLGNTPNTFALGDSVKATGEIRAFNAQIQLGDGSTPVTLIEKIGTTRVNPAPKTVKITELAANEGLLVNVANLTFDEPTKGLFYPDVNFGAQTPDGRGEVRINRFTNLVGFLKPAEVGNVTGVVSRFRNNAGTTDVYQLLPRQREDIPKITTAYRVSEGNLTRAQTLDVAAWNVKWFGNPTNGPANSDLQIQNVKAVIDSLKADVYVLSEVSNETRFAALLGAVNATQGGKFAASCSNEVSGGGAFADVQRVCFLYNTDVFKNPKFRPLLKGVSAAMLPNYPIDANRFWASGRLPYLMTADAVVNGFTQKVNLVGIHARANTSTAEAETIYQQRKYDIKALKDTLDARFGSEFVLLAGDFNDDVDETVAAVTSTKESSYKILVDDVAKYQAITKTLSERGFRTFVSSENVIDHLVVSDEWFKTILPQSVGHELPFRYLADYANTTSDHFPIFARFNLQTLVLAVAPIEAESIAVFPNPTAGRILEIKTPENVRVEAVELLGLTGIETPVSFQQIDKQHFVVQIAPSLSSGLYILRIKTATGILNRKVFLN